MSIRNTEEFKFARIAAVFFCFPDELGVEDLRELLYFGHYC